MLIPLITRTERLVFPRQQLVDCGDHLILRTPTNPSYFDGNSLILASPLRPEELPRWEARFAEAHPEACHRVFEWSGDLAEPEDKARFSALGYEHALTAVMSTDRPQLGKPADPRWRVHLVNDDEGWREVLAFWLRLNPQYSFAFLARRAADYAERQGPGGWWVARDERDQIVGGLGLYFDHQYGRFQNIEVHPDHRRAGVCRALMTHALQHAAEHYTFERVVISADVDDFPIRFNRQLGFETDHLQTWIFRRPQ